MDIVRNLLNAIKMYQKLIKNINNHGSWHGKNLVPHFIRIFN